MTITGNQLQTDYDRLAEILCGTTDLSMLDEEDMSCIARIFVVLEYLMKQDRPRVSSEQDTNTILAALRLYQHNGFGDPGRMPDWLFSIASDNGCAITLNDEAIDELCTRINSHSGHAHQPERHKHDNHKKNSGEHRSWWSRFGRATKSRTKAAEVRD